MLDPDTGEGNTIFGELLTAEKRAALESVKMGPITKFLRYRLPTAIGPWRLHQRCPSSRGCGILSDHRPWTGKSVRHVTAINIPRKPIPHHLGTSYSRKLCSEEDPRK